MLRSFLAASASVAKAASPSVPLRSSSRPHRWLRQVQPPLDSPSTTTTGAPRASNSSQTKEPIRPKPPVTATVLDLFCVDAARPAAAQAKVKRAW